jgi:hypothetical protein
MPTRIAVVVRKRTRSHFFLIIYLPRLFALAKHLPEPGEACRPLARRGAALAGRRGRDRTDEPPLSIETYEAKAAELEGGGALDGLTLGQSVTRLIGLILAEDWRERAERRRASRLIVRLALLGWTTRDKERQAT